MRVLEVQEDARLTHDEFQSVLAELSRRGYPSLLRSTASNLKTLSKSASKPEEILEFGRGRIRAGPTEEGLVELFPKEEGTLYLLQPAAEEGYERDLRYGRIVQIPTTLQAGLVSKGHEADDALRAFGDAANDAIRETVDGRRLRGMTLEWKSLRPVGRSVKTLTTPRTVTASPPQYQTPLYTAAEAKLAEVLADGAVRTVLLEILEAGKARLTDVVGRSENHAARSDAVANLADSGLIAKEYLVVCTKSSRALTHVGAIEEIRLGATGRLPCAECGRKFSEERVEEIVLPTELGRNLTSGSRWMQIWLTERLEHLGIPRSEIVWNLIRAAEDIDVIAGIQGTLAFFELKDREFGLGDAYPFNYRVGRYGGEIGVVLTCDKVAADAKTFFLEQSRSRLRGEVVHEIHIIEGLSQADDELQKVVNSITQSYLEWRLEAGGVKLRLSRLALR